MGKKVLISIFIALILFLWGWTAFHWESIQTTMQLHHQYDDTDAPICVFINALFLSFGENGGSEFPRDVVNTSWTIDAPERENSGNVEEEELWALGSEEIDLALIPTINIDIFTRPASEWTQAMVEDQLDGWNYCQTDEDCQSLYGYCPFACAQVVNKQHIDDADELMREFVDQQEEKCVYDCRVPDEVKCLNWKKKCSFLLQ